MLEYASPLIKVTIVPRGKSLGAAWYLPEERQLTTTEQMLDEICAAMGGRAAEEVFFDKISTGALSDLEKVTKMAYAMVSMYGLSKVVGNISYYDSSGQQTGFTKPYSEERAKLIDLEVSKILDQQYQRAKEVLIMNKEKVEKLGSELLDKEVIFKSDLESIFGNRKWQSYEEEQLLELDKKKVKLKKSSKAKKNDKTS
jgi:cell division protease FtsH